MLQPKKTKFRKAFKGRMNGNAKGGTSLNFGSWGQLGCDSYDVQDGAIDFLILDSHDKKPRKDPFDVVIQQ